MTFAMPSWYAYALAAWAKERILGGAAQSLRVGETLTRRRSKFDKMLPIGKIACGCSQARPTFAAPLFAHSSPQCFFGTLDLF